MRFRPFRLEWESPSAGAGAAEQGGIHCRCGSRKLPVVRESTALRTMGRHRHPAGRAHGGENRGIVTIVTWPGVTTAASQSKAFAANAQRDPRTLGHFAREAEVDAVARSPSRPCPHGGERLIIPPEIAGLGHGYGIAARHDRVAKRPPCAKKAQAFPARRRAPRRHCKESDEKAEASSRGVQHSGAYKRPNVPRKRVSCAGGQASSRWTSPIFLPSSK